MPSEVARADVVISRELLCDPIPRPGVVAAAVHEDQVRTRLITGIADGSPRPVGQPEALRLEVVLSGLSHAGRPSVSLCQWRQSTGMAHDGPVWPVRRVPIGGHVGGHRHPARADAIGRKRANDRSRFRSGPDRSVASLPGRSESD